MGTEACGYEDWVGDGYCDNSDSPYGINYYCEEFNWDEGDCDDDGGGEEGCEEGYLDDCSGDGDCCPEEWVGDGYADCEDQPWGCDLSCYDNDNGDCDDDGGGVSIMIGNSTGNPGESVDVPLFYESSESIGGIQFTIEDSPDWLVSISLDPSNDDCFEASFNEIDGSLIGILFSFEGCELYPSDSALHFSTITYEVSSEANWGSEIELSFVFRTLDIFSIGISVDRLCSTRRPIFRMWTRFHYNRNPYRKNIIFRMTKQPPIFDFTPRILVFYSPTAPGAP
mgnify:CR=1 FL=1